MKPFIFSHRSEKNLQGVHPDLIAIVRGALAISEVDFCVIEGIRTMERQRELKSQGHSQILNSRHLTGHAVDLAPIQNQSIPWEHWKYFVMVANAMKDSAITQGVPIVWGGDWPNFKDGAHFELPVNN